MSRTSVSISQEHGSKYSCDLFRGTNDILTIDVETYILGYLDHPQLYDACRLHFHGKPEDFRRLGQQILDAVAPVLEPAPEPECACRLTGDQADASQCDVHSEGGALEQAIAERNAGIAEPLRSIVNAISPHVPIPLTTDEIATLAVEGEDCPFDQERPAEEIKAEDEAENHLNELNSSVDYDGPIVHGSLARYPF